jgi:hypothetical protein
VRNSNATVSYVPLENVMEKKAIALGIRREFFQYLQKQRVSWSWIISQDQNLLN